MRRGIQRAKHGASQKIFWELNWGIYFNAGYHYPLMKPIFTRRDPHECQFLQGIVRCPRFGISAANQAQCDTPGSPLMCLSIYDPWFPVAVFLPQPIAV